MIRSSDPDFKPGGMMGAKIWFGILGLLVLMCVWLAWRYYQASGASTGLMFLALALFGVGTGMWLWRQAPNAAETKASGLNESLVGTISLTPEPALLTRGHHPVSANKPYLDLCRGLGVSGIGERPPTIDRLFDQGNPETAAAVFRLHHPTAGETRTEETIETVDAAGCLRRFQVSLNQIEGHEVWRVVDISDDGDQLDDLLALAPVGLASIDQSGVVLAVNDSLRNWMGINADETPKHLGEIISAPEALLGSPRTPGRIVRADARLITRKGIATPTVMVGVWRQVKDDHYVANVALHGHSSPATPARPAVSATSSKAETNANDAAETADFAAAPIAIVELDSTALSTAQVKRGNAAFHTMTGSGEGEARLFSDMFEVDEKSLDFLALDASECSPDTPFDAVLKGAGKDDVSVSVYIVADAEARLCRVYLVDISVRKSLENQLVQSQKMQAIGRLVAEIAHDFNNLLAAVRLNTDTLLERHPIGDPSYPELQQINSNSNRAAALVKKLLGYSRRQTVRAVRLDVSETMSDMAVTLKQVMGERVSLDMVHGRNLPPIKIDRNQIDTILMNLAVNARDAMKEQGGGQITIESEAIWRDAIETTALRGALSRLKGDEFVRISVADTGSGMTEETQSKIFEPFFTTKAQGEGTGLGLATVYGIVEQAGGYLAVDSELGKGTTFSIYLPAFQKSEEDEDGVIETAKPVKTKPPADLAGQGNILFVEDEEAVRAIAAKTLRKRGYNVVEAGNGDEAYEILEDGETQFDLMISDVVMPGMDGPSLLKAARPMLGEARIVFISGYAEEEFSDLLAEEPDVTFLPKPFSLVQLAEKVKAEIGGA